MTPDQDSLSLGSPESSPPVTAEARRAEARRRFLRGAVVASSGVVVVTLCHQRAFARRPGLLGLNPATPTTTTQQTYQPRGVLVSSQLKCLSLQGSVQGQTTVMDSITNQPVTRVDCVRN